MRHPIFLSTVIILFFASCSNDDFDTDGFQPITEELVFQTLMPSESFDFYEFRLSFCGPEEAYNVIFGQGEACTNANDQETCLDEINALAPENIGFNVGCLPACCSRYVVSQLGTENMLYDTTEKLVSFLGPIDSISDALTLVEAHGYYYSYNNIGKSGFKEIPGGYEIIALRTTAFCAPIITMQYRIQVLENGTLEILEEREESRDNNACI